MIVAKTNLKKIPEACNKCKFSYTQYYLSHRYCSLLNNARVEKKKLESGNYGYIGRLKNCPLIKKEL